MLGEMVLAGYTRTELGPYGLFPTLVSGLDQKLIKSTVP
jgi:hypothetical protein